MAMQTSTQTIKSLLIFRHNMLHLKRLLILHGMWTVEPQTMSQLTCKILLYEMNTKDKSSKRVLLQGTLRDGLYQLPLSINSQNCSTGTVSSSAFASVKCNKAACCGVKNLICCKGENVASIPEISDVHNVAHRALLATGTSATLWHAKLGHPAQFVLKTVLNTMYISYSKADFDACSSCKLGKLHKLLYP
ncbi:hypothetical protein ACOSQ3_012459 [Xanthoceras sorbifolium]